MSHQSRHQTTAYFLIICCCCRLKMTTHTFLLPSRTQWSKKQKVFASSQLPQMPHECETTRTIEKYLFFHWTNQMLLWYLLYPHKVVDGSLGLPCEYGDCYDNPFNGTGYSNNGLNQVSLTAPNCNYFERVSLTVLDFFGCNCQS